MQVLTLERQQYFLSTVSRTFALTIPLLPKEVEDWVGNSYLLCRITDTIEDAVYLDKELKKIHMQKFASFLSSPIGLEQWTSEICELVRSSSNDHENELMAAIPEVVGRYYSYPAEIQHILRHTVTIMAKGMSQIERWEKIDSLDEVDHYCYSVAGVVGELLISLFAEHSPAMKKTLDSQLPYAVTFGEALQLTNILKDVWDDLKRGVTWLPIKNTDPDRDSKVQEYISVAYGHCLQAMEFIKRMPVLQVGIRHFCLLTNAMAILTLRNIQANPGFKDSSEIKITRAEVKKLYYFYKYFGWCNFAIDFMTKRCSGSSLKPIIRSCEEIHKKVSFWK